MNEPTPHSKVRGITQPHSLPLTLLLHNSALHSSMHPELRRAPLLPRHRLPGPKFKRYGYRFRFHSSQPTPWRPSAVVTVAHALGNSLIRPSQDTSRTGA